MAEISEERTLELERQRAELFRILTEKGLTIEPTEPTGVLIPLVSELNSANSMQEFISGSNTQLIDSEVETICGYCQYQNQHLVEVDIPNAEYVEGYAFYGCTDLETVELPNVINIGAYSFYGCTSLTTLSLLRVASMTGDYQFTNCTNLETLRIPRYTSYVSFALDGCTHLTLLDLGVASIRYKIPAIALNTLILRSITVCNLYSKNYINNGNPEGLTIYVPQSLYNDYKNSTNWSVFTDCFEVLEGSPYEDIDWE